MVGEKKEPRHRVMAGPADILPALTRLSLVGLLLSHRTPLCGEMFEEELARKGYAFLMTTEPAGRDGRSLLGALCPFLSLVSGVFGNEIGGSPSGVDPVWEISRIQPPRPPPWDFQRWLRSQEDLSWRVHFPNASRRRQKLVAVSRYPLPICPDR